jgi:L-malate glycosyltransferase
MRICYLADGRYIHAHRWLRYFSERGHDMSLFSFAPMKPHHLAAVKAAGGKYQGQLENFHVKRFWRTVRQVLALRKFLRQERIDIVHSHFLGSNAWYGALSGFHPTVLTVMGGDICGPEWQPGNDIRERWLTPLALRRADLITCWSPRLTDVVKRYARPGTPVEVIHGGIDLDRFTPGPKPDYLLARWQVPANAKVILSPRLMRPLYNLDRIAMAASEVCRERADVYFLFAYLPEAKDDDYEERVHAMVRQNSTLSDRVKFIGSIAHEEMADHFRLADVTVSIPNHDGTPMSVLESMACATPVVVSDIPDYDSYYIEPEETVVTAKPNDSASLANSLLRLLNDPALAARLASEAKQRVETKGSYESQMSRMERLYQELL